MAAIFVFGFTHFHVKRGTACTLSEFDLLLRKTHKARFVVYLQFLMFHVFSVLSCHHSSTHYTHYLKFTYYITLITDMKAHN